MKMETSDGNFTPGGHLFVETGCGSSSNCGRKMSSASLSHTIKLSTQKEGRKQCGREEAVPCIPNQPVLFLPKKDTELYSIIRHNKNRHTIEGTQEKEHKDSLCRGPFQPRFFLFLSLCSLFAVLF
jgi:hypothetical protein